MNDSVCFPIVDSYVAVAPGEASSAVCSQISVEELSYAANLIQSRNFRAFEAFIVATALYLLLSILARRLLNWLGPRFLFGR